MLAQPHGQFQPVYHPELLTDLNCQLQPRNGQFRARRAKQQS